jgi:carboxyl-terminal processing protease
VTNDRLIYDFAFEFADSHRETLESYGKPREIAQYLDSKDVYSRFLNYAFDNGIPEDIGGISKSKDVINTRLKAYIARNIMDNEGFYPIIHEVDQTFKKAANLLARGKNQ